MSAPSLTLDPTAPASAPRALLQQLSASSLLSNITFIYRRHFGVLMSCSLLPLLPCLALMQLFKAMENEALGLLALLLYAVAAFLSSSATTVVVSDICLGNRPTVARAFGRILGARRWWHVLSTGLLAAVGAYAGMLLLVLPGLWFVIRALFASTIVALEGRRNVDAIKRSFALTKGQAWRLTGLTLLPSLLAFTLAMLVGTLVVLAGMLAAPDSELVRHSMEFLATVLIIAVLMPVAGCTIVLLYYDQRVRREAYDVQELTEDLMR